MKKIFAFLVLLIMMMMFTGCAWNRFNITDTAQSIGEATIAATLANNPNQKTVVCADIVNLSTALNSPCCWKDYIVQISQTFNQPTYEPYAIFLTRMLKDDAPLVDYINMSDGDKANIKKVFSNIATDVGCK